MSSTELSIEALNFNRGSFLANPDLPPHAVQSAHDSATIAPWGEPDEFTPPPPVKERNKASFPNLRMHYSKASSHSLLHLRSSTDSTSTSVPQQLGPSTSNLIGDDRERESRKQHKSKASFMNILKRQRSRPRGSEDNSAAPTSPPPLPTPPFVSSPSYYITPMLSPKHMRKKARHAPTAEDQPPPVPPKDPGIDLDLVNGFSLEAMDGIIDPSAHPDWRGEESPTSRSSLSISDHSYTVPSSPPLDGRYPASLGGGSSSAWTNPFKGSSTRRLYPLPIDSRKISPKTRPPQQSSAGSHAHVLESEWKAPESWAVEKEQATDEESIGPSSSEDESFADLGMDARRHSISGRKRRKSKGTRSPESQELQIRIYRQDHIEYRIITAPLNATVAELMPQLDKKMRLEAEKEAHRLYIKERGRERMLASTERPVNIVHRRLEQAGYAANDHHEALGGRDINFLLRFVYKSQVLGAPGDVDVHVYDFEFIDLTGRSLRAIPIMLHQNAEKIVSLNLGGNPMIEIPLDFIQSCTKLRELKLSNMAMKKIPQSLRSSLTLNRVDASSNRVADLEEAALDRIPNLTHLRLQNNRIERLPSYFGQLSSLLILNISNNKFQEIPEAIAEMRSLKDLDVSFNLISEIPPMIGHMTTLEKLTIVGNRISKFPPELSGLVNLRELDCRRNMVSSISSVSSLSKLETLRADHNALLSLDLSLTGPCLTTLATPHNDITQFTLVCVENRSPSQLTVLDISHGKLASLENFDLGGLQSLQSLRLCYNSFLFLPDSIGELSELVRLYCSDNKLRELPESIGRLQKLEVLDVHNNSLQTVPASIWTCGSLKHINFTSNLLKTWHDPPASSLVSAVSEATPIRMFADRKTSAVSVNSSPLRSLPPLALRLERLYLGENQLTEDSITPFTILRELRVLNLSFNGLQEIPASFFRNLILLEELYLSGNKLSSIPTEDLHRLVKLSVLYLNGNKLQTLPAELCKVSSLTVLDVGSNTLKYNIHNWEFDWNWNFNKSLKCLNLSGNKRLEIKPDQGQRDHGQRGGTARQPHEKKLLADFSGLTCLRILGLMDVTTSFGTNIPDEHEDRRVRTTLSEVNRMGYGIADHLGKFDRLGMFDLVKPDFRKHQDETIYAMFGRANHEGSHPRFSKYLQENFLETFSATLKDLDASRGEDVRDALRRSFLRLNKQAHDTLQPLANTGRKMSHASQTTIPSSEPSLLRNGASGIVLYFQGKKMFIANAGDGLAVISRQGSAKLVSRKHDPFDRLEAARIRAAEGWVSPKGLVNEEIDVSRSFGFYHLLPAVNPQPDVFEYDLREDDEFVIVANRGLWDYVSYQTAVDIARSELGDALRAAQKLRDFAISYGAEGATMIMVISVSKTPMRKDTIDLIDPDYTSSLNKRRPTKEGVGDLTISRLPGEVPAPTGHVALVFTDIRNSTVLWEANPGMAAAMRIHNNLLRRQLRLRGGYEVKTEGDAFMCSFPTVLSAVYWCLEVQVLLLSEPWPLEILECEDGKEVFDKDGQLIARGLSVRMGVHAGIPVCEPDPITERMDYFGPVTIRASRISGHARGGQILCSAEVVREIEERLSSTGRQPEVDAGLGGTIEGIRDLQPRLISVGELKLKGMEVPESLSLLYPESLLGRQDITEPTATPDVSASKIHYSIEQMRELARLCIRLEALSSSRVFRPVSERRAEEPESPRIMYGDPNLLMPNIKHTASDEELALLLDSLAMRIENTLDSLVLKHAKSKLDISHILSSGGADQQVISSLLSLLSV